MTHPKARCSALDSGLLPCYVSFSQHALMSDGSHEFLSRPERKSHIPWSLFGQDHAYCGRRPHHYAEPSDMQFLQRETQAAVRSAARLNVVCTSCFKNWVYLQQREAFIGTRDSW